MCNCRRNVKKSTRVITKTQPKPQTKHPLADGRRIVTRDLR